MYLFVNPLMTEEYEKNALKWAKSFDWNVAALNTLEILKKCIEKTNHK